jgi:ribonuclease Z
MLRHSHFPPRVSAFICGSKKELSWFGMKIILLGTAGYHPNDRRHTAAVLLPASGVLLDAGTATYRAARFLETRGLDIFLTHAHVDHVIGLTYLFDLLREHPLDRVRVHALPEHLAAIDEHLFALPMFPKKPPYESCPLCAEVAISDSGRLTWFPLAHQGGSIGLRLDWPGRSMAYVTDTTAAPDADYIEKIAGVDLLLHECYYGDADARWARETGHSSTSLVAQAARRAGVGRLVLVHINPSRLEDDPVGLAAARAVFPNTQIGEDLMELEF